MKRTAFFPGSFDPFTKGHEDIVLRALTLFDEIVIGIGQNSNKQRYFNLEKMKGYIEQTFEGKPVRVVTYQNLTANVAKEVGAKFIIRGLRNTTDFEYENSISQVNRHINEELETVFLLTSPHLAPIWSTIIRDFLR
ncbi:MAG: pantetheine-phosphate adenylyltransferase [Bacteroidota bacterium]